MLKNSFVIILASFLLFSCGDNREKASSNSSNSSTSSDVQLSFKLGDRVVYNSGGRNWSEGTIDAISSDEVTVSGYPKVEKFWIKRFKAVVIDKECGIPAPDRKNAAFVYKSKSGKWESSGGLDDKGYPTFPPPKSDSGFYLTEAERKKQNWTPPSLWCILPDDESQVSDIP